MDASAKPNSGFIWGNNFWFGSQIGCESLNKPLSITLSPRYQRIMKSNLVHAVAPYSVQYLVAHVKHHSPWQFEEKFLEENILHIGLCMPMSCNLDEVFNMTQTYFDNREDDFQTFYEMEPEVIEIKDLRLREGFFTKRSIFMLCLILGTTVLLHIISYLLKDNLDLFSTTKQYDRILQQTVGHASNESEFVEIDTREKILTSFSFEKNLQTIFNSNFQREVFPIIGGLK